MNLIQQGINKGLIKFIEKNIERDCNNFAKLKALGWTVLRFWETEIRKETDKVLENIVSEYYKSNVEV